MEEIEQNSGNNGAEIPGEGDKVAQRTFGEGGGQQGGGAGGGEQFVPYSRFQEVNSKFRDMETRYAEMSKALEDMKNPKGNEDKELEAKFYKDPLGTMREMLKSNIDSLKAEGTERQIAAQRQSAVNWFRSQAEYSPELEEKAAQFIKDNGLTGIDPEKATKLAYQFVTMGEGSGYTRQTKEGLKKPGAGGRGQEFDYKKALAEIDPQDPDYEKKMKEIHAKVTGR
jgi:hypothetical protein